MLDEGTRAYAVRPNQETGHRLDFVYFHPDLQWIREYRARRDLVPLGNHILEPEYGLGDSASEVGHTRYLTVQHILPHGDISPEPEMFVGAPSPDALLRRDDILIARTGFSLGKAAAITAEYDGFAFGSFCLRLRMRRDAAYSSGFVSRFLNSRFGQAQTRLLRTGSDKPNINTDQVKDIRLPSVSPDRQAEIIRLVQPLETAARAAANEARSAHREAERLFLERLNVTAPDRQPSTFFFQSSEEATSLSFAIAPPPRGRLNYLFHDPRNRMPQFRALELTTLGAAADGNIIRGEQPDFEELGTRVALKTVDVTNDGVNLAEALRVDEDFFSSCEASHVRNGDVIVTATGYGSLGKVAVFDSEEPAMISGELLAFSPTRDYEPRFLAHWLRSPFGRMQFDRFFSGSSGQIHLYDVDLERFAVPAATNRGVSRRRQVEIADEVDAARRNVLAKQERARERWARARESFEDAISRVLEDGNR